MRAGFSLKEAAMVLDIHERRVTQSLDPSLRRIALLWRVDPTATMECLLEAVRRLEPMSDREIEMRTLMAEGRLDRRILHPPPESLVSR